MALIKVTWTFDPSADDRLSALASGDVPKEAGGALELAVEREAATRLEGGTLLPSGTQHADGTWSGYFEFATELG